MVEMPKSSYCPRCGGLLEFVKDICVHCGYVMARTSELECGATARLLEAAEERAGQAWAAGVKLAEEVAEHKRGIDSLADEMWKCAIAYREKLFERNMARSEIVQLQIWASMRACANYIEGVWADGQPECGRCVPCQARATINKVKAQKKKVENEQ